MKSSTPIMYPLLDIIDLTLNILFTAGNVKEIRRCKTVREDPLQRSSSKSPDDLTESFL